MRKLFLFLVATGFLVACNNQASETSTTATADNGVTVALPVPALYSSSFKMGNPDYAAMIVKGSWTDWSENKLDNMKNWMADSILAYHSNDQVVQGLDSMMAVWKRERANYSSSVDSIEAVLPVYSTDKNENWVLVWARGYGTRLDGTKDTASIMETWRINKDGKADFLLQYDRAKRKK
jgi:hypothetical protein